MELWDIYDKDRNKTGRTHERGRPMTKGDYHLVVHIIILNSKGEMLLTKRTPNKEFGNLWEFTGGSAITGDTSLMAALREVKEETGISLDKDKGEIIFTYSRVNNHYDVWVFQQDFAISEVVLQEGETCDAKWATEKDIRIMLALDEFVPVYTFLDELFAFKDKYLIAQSIAYCGLVCKLCHVADSCSGCRSVDKCCGMRTSLKGCFQYSCCIEKGIEGCWECEFAPCDKGMFSVSRDLRLRAFIRFIKDNSKERIAECLYDNMQKGIYYGHGRDYDNLASEQDVIKLLNSNVKV